MDATALAIYPKFFRAQQLLELPGLFQLRPSLILQVLEKLNYEARLSLVEKLAVWAARDVKQKL